MAEMTPDVLRKLDTKAREKVPVDRFGKEKRFDETRPEFAAAVAALRADTGRVSFASRTEMAEYIWAEEFLAERGL